MKAPAPRLHGWPRLFLDLAGLSLGLAVAGLAVRLTVRDWVPGLAALYYLTPGAVIAAAFAFSALAAALARRRRWAARCLALALLTGGLWVGHHWVPDPKISPSATRPALRLLYWNLAGPFAAWDALGAVAAEFQPDLIAFSEARIVPGTPFTLAESRFPSHHFWQNNDGLMVFSRWPLEQPESGDTGHRCRWATLVVRHPAGPFRLALADLDSNPLRFRRGMLADWRARTLRAEGWPEIVAGDFNTPFDSVWFRDLASTHLHAFTTAGRGLHVTWPLPCPVLALDHVWTRGWLPLRTRRHFSRHSDHAALVVDLALPAPAPP